MENNEKNVQDQDQEKKQSKGLSVGLVVIMLIAVLIISIGGGYLLSKNDSLFNKNETNSNNNSSNSTQSNNNTSGENSTMEQNTVTNTTPTTSIQDFSIMKEVGFANTTYETDKKQGEKYYKVSFDSNCNPTIYIEDVGSQPYATYRKFYNIKSDVATGTTYITFDFKILNETEDGGKGEIKYSNVADNTFISIKLNYPPTEEYIELQKVTTSSTNYDKYNMAIAEIKKCLKDENWLKEKEITGSYEPYNEENTIKTYFARLDSINNKPYYVVCSEVFDSSYLRVISYDYGESKVVVSSKCGADYGSVKIDINNNIVEVNATMYVAYYKIVDGRFEFLERADNSGDGVDEGRKKLEGKYRKSYNFVEINTQLTERNIETYIK